MPKKTDPLAELEDEDREAAARLIGFARQLGRAVALSVIAANSNERTEDVAIEAADNAWENLVTDIILFAMEQD